MPRTNSSSLTSVVVGEEIRRARLRHGLTQAQLGTRLGAAATYVAAIERGRENLTLGSLARIADALGTALRVSFPALRADYQTVDEDLEVLREEQREAPRTQGSRR
jgi:transcriptional regulator with XRE-family HTH domain